MEVSNYLIFSLDNPSPKDSGIYQCCVSTLKNYRQCVWSSVCTGFQFKPSTPFQINHFQSKPLLGNGALKTIVWTFNVTNWKISSRYPQCKPHLLNLEKGIEQWFEKSSSKSLRNKRNVIKAVLGGLGAIGSLLNAMDINSLRSGLKTVGYIGSKSTRVQKDLNQLMENMVLKTESVLGSSFSHLQDATLALIESDQESQIARAYLEIQIEYSTNLKMIAQALQRGITPLGLLRNLPVEYNFSLGHSDLWVNKWLGCKQDICIGTLLIPVTGNEQIVVPMTTLGIPVSNTQLLYYQLQYIDFVFTDENIVQIDLSSCQHFISKVICLPGQDKEIYHSCFHNHTSCKARIENVHTIYDIITPVESWKVCLHVMSDKKQVMALFSSCIRKILLEDCIALKET